MVETDWREILSFSQRELNEKDKEVLCESLSWMEADDIELNFSDLKSLFRLAQDILKYKSEQVNNLKGQMESLNKKGSKKKGKQTHIGSPVSNDSAIETLAHQEEEIKANKDILEQLYADIAELEGRKSKLVTNNALEDSDTSRDALSEMDAVVQLENEVARKNRHIRKLLGDIKDIEEENTNLKKKITVLKDKLTEATQIIDSMTEQLLSINNECVHLKDILGKSERLKAQQSNELESLRKELFEKDSKRENIFEEIKAKVQHWKNIAKTKKSELEALSLENINLKEELNQAHAKTTSSPKHPKVLTPKHNINEVKLKELQEKLTEASNEIEESANLISKLKIENRNLKKVIEETPENSMLDVRNQSDDGKERTLISKLKKRIKLLSVNLQNAEEIIAGRERELAEVSSELQLLQSDDGVKNLTEALRHKTHEMKVKDEGIKSLVQEINTLTQQISDLQLENETMRQKLNIPNSTPISTKGVVRKYVTLERNNTELLKKLRSMENKLVDVELINRKLSSNCNKMGNVLKSLGYNKCKIEEMIRDCSDDENAKNIEAENVSKESQKQEEVPKEINEADLLSDAEMKAIAEENEGLRKGLQEILEFLKDNSTTSSGILSLQCPSLEALLRSMEARHSAGWFAPHMATIMELRAAIGGKDALLVALHEARKETYDYMSQLTKETEKSLKLERQLKEIESKQENITKQDTTINISNGVEFGTWIADKDSNKVDFTDKLQVDSIVAEGNSIYEGQLRKGLEYFCNKFKILHDKVTSITVQTSDDQNKWSILEEQYKAQIENLKSQIQQMEDDDTSDDKSPGIISIPNPFFLQRKCSYLEESYKYIRTLNENLKNENMEAKKEIMTVSCEYETEIQRLILAVVNLTDKLRNSMPVDLFWKQNISLNEITGKYRNLLESKIDSKHSDDLVTRLDNFRLEIISRFRGSEQDKSLSPKEILSGIEETVLKKQLKELCLEIESKNKQIGILENNLKELHETQTKIIDKSLSSLTQQEIDLIKSEKHSAVEENKILKEKCKHISNQLDIALLQLQEHQQTQLGNDLEVNLLRHQILDLQSSSDNKAILSRLSSEVLVAHLQASESYKKIERLNSVIMKEKELRAETEEMLKARQNIFEVYSYRFECKFRSMFEIMQVLRQQYQGSIPLTSIENYVNKMEDVFRESKVLNEKLQEIEDLRSSLMAKHSVFDQILDVSRNKCFDEEDSCAHKLKAMMMESVHIREIEHIKKKLNVSEQSREDLTRKYNQLEKTLVLVNQGFEHRLNDVVGKKSDGEISIEKLELEDIHSDNDGDDESSSRRSKTITLPKPQVLKPLKGNNDVNATKNDRKDGYNGTTKSGQPNEVAKVSSPTKDKDQVKKLNVVNVEIQTVDVNKKNILIQTIEDKKIADLKQNLNELKSNLEKKSRELSEAMALIQGRTRENLNLSTEKMNLEAAMQSLKTNTYQKDDIIETLNRDISRLNNEIQNLRCQQLNVSQTNNDALYEQNKSLINSIKQMEKDKNAITTEYKQMLNNEREAFVKTTKELNLKVMELQSKLDNREASEVTSSTEPTKEYISKYTMKIVKLEDQCFKLQNDLDECKAELSTYKTEADRWKDLAVERLAKMEQLNSQLNERHCHEVESYKAENQHWLLQLNETQKEHMELRSRLTDQKAIYMKQLSEKDSQMEHMRSVINNLKAQIMSMQTMISVHDPSFDLSAIVEVEECTDALSQPGSDRLEIRFDSSGEINDMADDFTRIQSTSTAIWHEPLIERLRRDKQLAGKQNALLRRQIKALAARERRSRLDAQNLKNQVFRISTSGGKVVTAETAALHNKIATLQAQLTSARRDTHSSIALWDKWKRAQQSSDRWQARYEEKCQELKKLEGHLNLTKSALSRLDREKRLLVSRLTELKCQDSNQLSIEKQESESPEKAVGSTECATCANAPPLSNHALLERVQAQQRRIVALEAAEKGNELLVSEYERALAEVTSLKGQVLKLESTLLESQIRLPIKTDNDAQPELDYWKNYCEMLKEENVQLNLRINTVDTLPVTATQHRMNDLEQTVLTLRGLVSKLQAEQKSGVSIGCHRRVDSRPNSGRSITDKNRSQQDNLRIELANLKRTLQDKDHLLERSKDMLKMAAEREDELLRENAYLRRQLNDLTRPKEGFLSA